MDDSWEHRTINLHGFDSVFILMVMSLTLLTCPGYADDEAHWVGYGDVLVIDSESSLSPSSRSKKPSVPPDSPNVPYGAAGWGDQSGHLIFFGGHANSDHRMFHQDLWQFDPSTQKWTLLWGDLEPDKNGVYGRMGHEFAGNHPGARTDAVGWTDNKGNHWIFGGTIQYSPSRVYFNDLWRYNPSSKKWTWMKGADTLCHQRTWGFMGVPFGAQEKDDKNPEPKGIYGTKGISDFSNTPGARTGSATWMDQDGNFWLFGGQGFDSQGQKGSLNDLWQFDHRVNQWIWFSGSDKVNQLGIYGEKGVECKDNVPGARGNSISWIDKRGNLWLFGGFGNHPPGFLNDLWKYNPKTLGWTWMSGSKEINQFDIHEEKGVLKPDNVPSARDMSVGWINNLGNLCLFGGFQYRDSKRIFLNDVWEYHLGTNEWVCVKGSFEPNKLPVFETPGITDPANDPGGRVGAYGWTDQSSNFRLFGGYGSDTEGGYVYLKDLWMYSKLEP